MTDPRESTMTRKPENATAPPEDPALRELLDEMTGLGEVLPKGETPEQPKARREARPGTVRTDDGTEFDDAEDLFDNLPL
jgi:hypothetical protein